MEYWTFKLKKSKMKLGNSNFKIRNPKIKAGIFKKNHNVVVLRFRSLFIISSFLNYWQLCVFLHGSSKYCRAGVVTGFIQCKKNSFLFLWSTCTAFLLITLCIHNLDQSIDKSERMLYGEAGHFTGIITDGARDRSNAP